MNEEEIVSAVLGIPIEEIKKNFKIIEKPLKLSNEFVKEFKEELIKMPINIVEPVILTHIQLLLYGLPVEIQKKWLLRLVLSLDVIETKRKEIDKFKEDFEET